MAHAFAGPWCLNQGFAAFLDSQETVSELSISRLSGRSVLNADDHVARAFTTGAFVRRGVAGLHISFHAHSRLTRLPACVVQMQLGMRVSSVSLKSNSQSSLRRDLPQSQL